MKKFLLILASALFSIILSAQELPVIKVLAIGNSFSEDSVEQNLWQIAGADGTVMVIGNMYIGGCSIDMHMSNIDNDSAKYRYTKISADGVKTVTGNVRLSEVIGDEQWDYVTVQQASHFSGFPSTYSRLPELVKWIYANAPQCTVIFHQTWAYSEESNHPSFPNYDSDQKKMYDMICRTVRDECPKVGIYRVIPTGTAIQKAREATKDFDFTRDGFHLDTGKGRYLAACTWYEILSGHSVEGNKYVPDGTEKGAGAVSKRMCTELQKYAHRACEEWKDAVRYKPSLENIDARKEFNQMRFGIFLHWGIYSLMGDGEWVQQVQNLNYREYPHLAGSFFPSRFDASEWVRAFKTAGAKYVTITSRHHDGFSMFGTKASDYNVVDATPFKRDVIAELADACHREGLQIHFYYSHLDWGRTDYWPLGRTGHGTGRPEGTEADWGHYQQFMKTQLTELLTNYGEVGAIWFDGLWDRDQYPRSAQPALWGLEDQYRLVHRLQPRCLVGNNHHMEPFPGEDMQIFERDVPGHNEAGYSGQAISKLPLETCQTMNDSWGYDILDKNYKSADDLIRLLAATAGKGANLLLNIGPRPDGTLPEEALERLEAIGRWLDRNGESIYGTDGGVVGEQCWGVSTQKDNVLYIHVLKHVDSISIPLGSSRNPLVKASLLADGTEVDTEQTKTELNIEVPSSDEPDIVVKLVFKRAL